MSYKTLKTEFERELILTLVLGMKRKTISDERAKIISKAFLQVLKKSNKCEEILNEVSILCPTYPEIMDVFIKVSRNFESEYATNNLKKVREEVMSIN